MQRLQHVMSGTCVLGLCLSLSACASTTSQLTSGAVEGTTKTISEPDSLDRIDRITSSPEFQRSIERVTASMARGIKRGATADIDVGELSASTEQIGRSLGRGLAVGFAEGLEELPDTGKLVDEAISGALASATSEQNQERTRTLISNATGTVVRTAMSSAAEGLEQDIAPSLDRVSGSAAPKLARVLADPEFRTALGGMFREVSRNATLGFDAGMEQLRESNRANQEGILGRGWVVSLLGAAFVLLLGAIVAIIVLGIANNRRRHEREEMLTSMLIAFAGHGAGLDEATRAELLRHLGVSSPWTPPSIPKPAPPPQPSPREGAVIGDSPAPVPGPG
jgi:hypothetical protein